jgi:3',5'-cyclic AMP phosphodiesterase CpdA
MRLISRPSFLLAQLTDPHIGATWFDDQSVPRFTTAVEAVRAVQPQPHAVLLSGDIADHASDEEYQRVRELLEPLGLPLYVLPGNHDDRRALSRHFGVPGAAGEPVQYSVDLGPLRLVVLDTTRPGEDAGELGPERLEWLDSELAAAPETLTLIAMHHSPVLTGIPVWDEIGLPAADRRALGEVIEHHRQVRRLVTGHVHRTITGDLAGRPVLTVPSTYVQARLNFLMEEMELAAEPGGFALHAVVDGELVSHVQPVS